MPLIYRDCDYCGFTFPARTSKSKFCSGAHRAAAWRKAQLEAAHTPPADEAEQARDVHAPEAPAAAIDLDQLADLVVQRLGGAAALAAPAAPAEELPPAGSVARATWDQLAKAGRAETPLGLASMVLAMRLDSSQGETGSALKSLAVGLREMLTSALSHAGAGSSPAPAMSAAVEDDDEAGAAPGAPVDMLVKLRERAVRRDGTGA